MEDVHLEPVGPAPAPVAPTPVPNDGAASRPTVDPFLARAGPDALVGRAPALLRVYAIFRVDPLSRSIRCEVVDETGRILRMIPPATVTEMLAAMASYEGR